MAIALKDYEAIVGAEVIDELRVVASRVRHRRLQNVNSTPVGGGVAEILARMVPLLLELGIEASWDVIKGDQAFFNITKAFHNALHGKAGEITEDMLDIYRANTEMNLREMNFSGDMILIHDAQPAGLTLHKKEIGRKWVWRCHIDVSTPDPRMWTFLRPYVEQYNASIFSMPDFAQQLLTSQFMVAPSIDPLSDKNKELEKSYINKVLEKYHLDPERPIVMQISRFDRLKDPLGVMAAYHIVKKRYDCQLVLAVGGIKLQIINGVTGFLVHSPEGAAHRAWLTMNCASAWAKTVSCTSSRTSS